MAPSNNGHQYECVSGTCMDHSGIATRMNIGIALLSMLCGLFGYSSFVQLPALEQRVADKVGTIETKVADTQREIIALKLEDLRLKAQRNADHPKKDPLP